MCCNLEGVGDLLQFLPYAKDFTQSLDFKIILVLVVIFLIAGILLGTFFGRMEKGREEARITERRKQRELRKQEALKRELAIMERYKQAKETGTHYDEAKYGPRPKQEDPSEGIEPEKPKKVQLITARPAYVTVKHKPGLSGTAPVRLKDERELEAHVAQGSASGWGSPTKAQPAVAKAVPMAEATPVDDGTDEDEEERKKREEAEARRKKEKEKEGKKGDGEDEGVDRISNLMSALDGMKKKEND